MIGWFRERYLDVLGSIYLYNEHRGYSALDRILDAVRQRAPDDTGFLAAIARHREDERKHYRMFRRWFERRGRRPLALGRAFGHIDRFVEIIFRRPIDRLDTGSVVSRDADFAAMCRVIALTERRGHRQLGILLRNPIVRGDPVLTRIFRIIEKDEPSHWAPYEAWLERHGPVRYTRWERLVDHAIHAELLAVKLPLLFLNPFARRQTRWPDADEGTATPARPFVTP